MAPADPTAGLPAAAPAWTTAATPLWKPADAEASSMSAFRRHVNEKHGLALGTRARHGTAAGAAASAEARGSRGRGPVRLLAGRHSRLQRAVAVERHRD